jgi:hypothetical protein
MVDLRRAAVRYRSPADLSAVYPAEARLRALQRLAWAQWTIEELRGGEPFRRLLKLPYPGRS